MCTSTKMLELAFEHVERGLGAVEVALPAARDPVADDHQLPALIDLGDLDGEVRWKAMHIIRTRGVSVRDTARDVDTFRDERQTLLHLRRATRESGGRTARFAV